MDIAWFVARRDTLISTGLAAGVVGYGAYRYATNDTMLLVQLDEQADLSDERKLPRGPGRREAVWKDLSATAARTQAPVAAALDNLATHGVVSGYESLKLGNTLLVRAPRYKVGELEDALERTGVALTVGRDAGLGFSPFGSARGVVDAAVGALLGAGDNEDAEGSPGWNLAHIGAAQVHDAGIDGAGVTVGVIDTGIDGDHPALEKALRDGGFRDFVRGGREPIDRRGHGTHVSGTVAGWNPARPIGVAPGAELLVASALGSRLSPTGIGAHPQMKAFEWMLAPTVAGGGAPDPRRGADVISNSWFTIARDAEPVMDVMLEQLLDAGVVVVSAAGNAGNAPEAVGYPGSSEHSITVAATDEDDEVARFSSRGAKDPGEGRWPDVAAPGDDVFSSTPGGFFGYKSGTSMATPAVAGVIALMLQANPLLDPEDVRTILRASARDIDEPGTDRASGAGLVDAVEAVRLAQSWER